ncbi:MAG TPA: hypothetical protein VGD24_10665 [Gallionella sp.]
MRPNFDTGRVRVRLDCAEGKISGVLVSCERPVVATVLHGRAADQVENMIPLLFSLCGKAQAQAAKLALAAAYGEECVSRLDPDVQRESLREHLWRCLIDFPHQLGEVPLQQEFVNAARWITEGDRSQLYSLLSSMHVAALYQRIQQIVEPHPVSPSWLPQLDARRSLAEWPRLSAEFCRQPDWRGCAAETGAMARQQWAGKNSISLFSACWQARFDELLEWARKDSPIGAVGTVSAIPVAPGIGRSLVETARGLLMHEIVLEKGLVADYHIAAPTEWNFHPQGALAHHLLGQGSGNRDALRQSAARVITALDPCVPWELEWA